MNTLNNLPHVLLKHKQLFKPILPLDVNDSSVIVIDFSGASAEFNKVDVNNTKEFDAYVQQQMQAHKASVAIGRYNEDRELFYSGAELFAGENPRTIHLGIDLYCKAGTPVFAPLDGKVHSFADNANFRDYGPTVILEHSLDGVTFYTLYGHLGAESLNGKHVGQVIKAGQQVATVGDFPINGDWPPHLHFQIMTTMWDKIGDFPGVSSKKDRDKMLSICVDPNLILGIKKLHQK